MQPEINALVIATHNPAKYQAISALLKSRGINVPLTCLADLKITLEVSETGSSTGENAVIKARQYAKHTGRICLSDDSGLYIDALDGAPGIRANRFAGPNATDSDKRAIILGKLHGVPLEQRTAQFRSAIAIAWPDGEYFVANGSMSGLISEQPRGTHIQQFPYCSIFIEPDTQQTIAELVDQGHALSFEHRTQAIQVLLTQIRFSG